MTGLGKLNSDGEEDWAQRPEDIQNVSIGE